MSIEMPIDPPDSENGIVVLRTTNQNQLQLIILADQKANILLGIMVVVFTILFTKSNYLQNIENQVAFFVFMALELSALVFAFLVILPKGKRQNRPAQMKDVVNPMYFGCFTEFNEDEYVEYLSQELKEDKTVNSLLMRDIYHVGLVLRKKYTLLKYAYICSALGVVLPALITVGSFVF